MQKTSSAIIVALLATLLFTSLAFAQTDVGISFGIRPTRAYEDRPETFSYFHHILAPGQVLDDEALVMNDSEVAILLKLYTADGISAQNGGTTFGKQGEAINGVSAWLSPSEVEIELGPGEEVTVPFTITVPAEVLPGHHVAGLVVEALPTEGQVDAGESEAQFVVSVVRRVGVAVVVEVPGEHIPSLEVTGARLSEQGEMGATFAVEVHNSGNVFLQSEGALEVYTPEGAGLVSIPLDLDAVLPGDTATFWITSPIHLADSDYSLIVRLDYADGTSLYEDAMASVRDGQPVVEGGVEEAEGLPSIAEIVPANGTQSTQTGATSIRSWASIAIGSVVSVVFAIIVVRRKRKRSTYPKDVGTMQ